MFEFLLRRTVFKNLSKEDQETAMLLKDIIKTDYISKFLIFIFAALPLSSFITILLTCKQPLSNVIQCIALIVAYIIFAIWFMKKFVEPINDFIISVSANIYSSRYVLKGNAILKTDFDVIKKENEKLHYLMMTQHVKGYCYSVCFNILKCLKKGTLMFIAVRATKGEDKAYTMHVLYVNDNWCFDTYSQRQYPLDKVIKQFKAKTYKIFTYEDIDGKTYDEFRKEQAQELQEWCNLNDCYHEWLKD